MSRKLLLTTFILATIVLSAVAGPPTKSSSITGLVRDSISHQPVPFISVMLKSAGWGKLTGEKGKFILENVEPHDTVVVSGMGYRRVEIPVSRVRKGKITIDLQSDGLQLKEVVVRPKKEKYSKKNNPAVDFVNRIRRSQDLTDPRRNAYYDFSKYEKITIALNNINPESNKNLILKKFDFLRQHIDTSEVSGRPILNLSIREKKSDIHYRRTPRSEKEEIIAVRQQGLDDFLNEQNMRTLYEDMFRDIDLYGNDIYMLRNNFVSPLSRIGPDFYKYYLTDTVTIDTRAGRERCIVLSFVPHNSSTFGFVGKIYVPEGDSTMFIRKVEMSVPRDINLNFITHLYINQEFDRAPDGSRLLMADDLIAELSVAPGTQGLYFRRNTAYTGHNFQPATTDVYDIQGSSTMLPDASRRSKEYWDSTRLIKLSRTEAAIPDMTARMRRSPFYYWTEKIIRTLTLGYVTTGPKSRFDIGPVNTVFSHNSVEGYRFRLGGMTTANLSPRLFFRGYGAYGTKDHRWKYEGQLEYSFVDKEYFPSEFPVHALRFTARYDMDMLGQKYTFTNADNFFLSLKRHDNYLMTYRRMMQLKYILELRNGFSVQASFESVRQNVSPYVRFVNGHGRSFSHYTETGFTIELRYAPGEKFYQGKTQRINISPQNPILKISHHYFPKKFLGNPFEVNYTEISFTQRYWLSAFGHFDWILKAGHLWSRSPFPNLTVPNANLSYTIQPESFALMNPMEFVTDSYASWDLAYWPKGAILNYIPILKKLKLREVFSFRGVFGHLSSRNDPERHPELFRFPEIAGAHRLGSTPYMEVGVGLDNIFKILRVDYVWRLTYRHLPDADKSGVRIALHFTF